MLRHQTTRHRPTEPPDHQRSSTRAPRCTRQRPTTNNLTHNTHALPPHTSSLHVTPHQNPLSPRLSRSPLLPNTHRATKSPLPKQAIQPTHSTIPTPPHKTTFMHSHHKNPSAGPDSPSHLIPASHLGTATAARRTTLICFVPRLP